MEDLSKALGLITNAGNIRFDEPMSGHTTFRCGGPADIFVTPNNIEEAAAIVRLLLARKDTFFILGNGSNLLVSDKGYRGTIVNIAKGCDFINVDGNLITAGAGALLSQVAMAAYRNSLEGLEFASGIPGTVGGAITMNAGAYGGEMKNVVKKVRLLDFGTGNIVEKSCAEMDFSYRYSIVKSQPCMILEVDYELQSGDALKIKSVMDELNEQRRSKQPLEYPSAGSTFKRPEGFFAGKLIQDAGLKGYSVNDACVSEKHSGFVVNKGHATATDIMELIRYVRKTVLDKFGVELVPEVILLGEGMEL